MQNLKVGSGQHTHCECKQSTIQYDDPYRSGLV